MCLLGYNILRCCNKQCPTLYPMYIVVVHSRNDVIKWKHFPRCWPFVTGIHRSPVDSPHKGQWRGALMFSWICAWINRWVNNGEAGDLRRYRAHYDVIVTCCTFIHQNPRLNLAPFYKLCMRQKKMEFMKTCCKSKSLKASQVMLRNF